MARKIKTEKRKLDELFSIYIRERDATGYETDNEGLSILAGNCITCTIYNAIKTMDCGHFITRGVKPLRFNEKNANIQCHRCNRFKDGEQYKHGRAIDNKWGEGTADSLLEIERQHKEEPTRWTLTEIDELRDHYKQKLSEVRANRAF